MTKDTRDERGVLDRKEELENLRSEIRTVERFLEETPPEKVITKKTWEGRLNILRKRLDREESKVGAHGHT